MTKKTNIYIQFTEQRMADVTDKRSYVIAQPSFSSPDVNVSVIGARPKNISHHAVQQFIMNVVADRGFSVAELRENSYVSTRPRKRIDEKRIPF